MKSSQARMKSSAFALDEMKSASSLPALAGFHHEVISSTAGGFLPTKADFVEKSTHRLGRQMCAFFWRRRWDLGPQRAVLCYADLIVTSIRTSIPIASNRRGF